MKIDAEKLLDLADRIVAFRAKYDLNQEQFAVACGLTKQTINAIESGKRNITKLTLAKINQVLAGGE